MYLRNTFGGRGHDRSNTQISSSTATKRSNRSRRAQMWVAALSVLAMTLTGASPALAEGDVEGTTTAPAAEQPAAAPTPAPVEPPPAPPAEPEPAPAPAPAPEPALAPAPAPEPEPEPGPTPAPDTASEPESHVDDATDQAATETKAAASTQLSATADAPAATTPEPPYLRWRVIDQHGTVQADTAVTVQGPNPGAVADDAAWVTTPITTVTDNTGASGYVGADLDPAPGYFAVKQLADDANPGAVHDVTADEQYRTRVADAPEGYSEGESADWMKLDTATSTEASVSDLLLQPAQTESVESTGKVGIESAEQPMLQAFAEQGLYSSTGDKTNPSGWYSAGSPCQACEIQDFTSSYEQSGDDWALTASWTRPNTEGAKGWSIEYTKAPVRWGGEDKGDMVPVPQPDRSQGGMVIFIDNNDYTVQACTYTSQQNYPGSCLPSQSGLLTSDDGGYTLDLHLPLSSDMSGSEGCPPTLGSTGYPRAWTGNNNPNARNVQAWAAPVTLTPPSNCGTTTLKITKMGDRNGTSLIPGNSLTQAAPVAGATYTAYASTSGQSAAPTGPALGTCVTDSSGVCTIAVSNANVNGVWVEETGTPSGWSNMPDLGTGAYNSAKTVTEYRFRVAVGTGTNNVTKNVTADRDRPNTEVSGAWVDVRDNPAFPEYCGISIAMVFDTSTSINRDEMESFKEAAQSFVGNTALGGTPSKATMFQFNTTASTMNSGNAYDLSIPGSAGGNTGYLGAANEIETALPASGSGYTNWDDALRLVNRTGAYDMVLFLTDGDPTTHGTSGSDINTNVQFRMVEQAVMSANALKASPGVTSVATKIVGVGVGLSSGSEGNLQAITGPTSGDDYFLTDDFDALKAQLQEIALKNCGGTLTVVKQTIDADGNVIEPVAGGWDFQANTDGAYIQNPPGANVASLTKTTPSSPAAGVNFAIDLDSAASRNVQVIESLQAGWTADAVSCTGSTWTGSPGDFTVTVDRQAVVSCTVTNREAPKDASLMAAKTWIITDGSGQELRRIHEPAQPGDDTLPTGISAVLSATGPAPAGATALAWGEARGGYKVSDQVTISETVTIPAALPGCAVTLQRLTEVNGVATDVDLKDASHVLTLAAISPTTSPVNLNEIEVTNTVKCTSKLSLLKSVQGGDANPDGWQLTAAGPGGPFTATGADAIVAGNTFEVTAGSGYALSEAIGAGGAITYLLDQVERCTSLAPGGGACAIWAPVVDVSAVSVDLGTHEIYRFVNKPAPAVAVPLTGGLSGDLFGLGGLGALILATLFGVLYWHRTRRQAGVQ